MPVILILFGVLGGAMAFGFIGVFIGPTLLSVCYRLVKAWSAAATAMRELETNGRTTVSSSGPGQPDVKV